MSEVLKEKEKYESIIIGMKKVFIDNPLYDIFA